MPLMSLSSLVLAGVLLAAPAGPAVASQPLPAGQPTPGAARADAYYEFMMARRLDGEGDAAGARAALERALRLDPVSAELLAELAGHHARQNQAGEAVAAAERAVTLDPDNLEANRVLALVYAAYAEGAAAAPPGTRDRDWIPRAIERLQRIQQTPAMATDLGLQLTLGRLLVRAARPDEAVVVLERLGTQAPYLPEPFLLLVEAHSARGDLDAAAEALARAARANPRYYATLGELLERQRRWAEAADAYERALETSRGQSRELRLRLAAVLLNVPGREAAARAERLLAGHLEGNAGDGRALALLAHAYRALGDAAAAEATARRLLALDATNLSAHSILALALADQRQHAAIVEALEPVAADIDRHARGRESDAARLLAQLGEAYRRLGRHDAAVRAFARARDLEPGAESAAAFVQALVAARRYGEAEAEAREALDHYPFSLRLRQLRAQALVRAGRPDLGVALLEELAADRPDDRAVLLALVDLYGEAGRHDAAEARLQAVLERQPDDLALRFRLGAAYEEAGRAADAERAFRDVLARDPRHAPALNYLGYMLADRGVRLLEALDLIQQALAVEPDNPHYLDSLGWALYRLGRLEEAEAPLRRAAAALVDSSVVQDHLGDLLARRRRWTEAVEAWERALAGDREGVDVGAIERKLRDARRRR